MQADMSSLLALCEKADYDIRSCLATLCFLKTLKRPLRYSDVINMNIGHKDNHKSLFQGNQLNHVAFKFFVLDKCIFINRFLFI